MKKELSFAITIVLLISFSVNAQVVRSFTTRYNNPSVKGSIKYVANSIVTTPSQVPAATGQVPPAGSAANTSNVGGNIDVDADVTTFNSSTADLALPACSQILFAGLYWGAGRGTCSGSDCPTLSNEAAWRVNEGICRLKLPGSATYTTITSTQTDYINPTVVTGVNFNMYQCFANITSLVTSLAAPTGTYTVANVANPTRNGTTGAAISTKNCFGGWTIIIVYANNTLLPRNLTVFDGCAAIRPSPVPALDVSISGFLTPPSPSPVSCEYGVVGLDGDRNDNDVFQFRQGPPPPAAGPFYTLSALTTPASGSGTSDFFNSRITSMGVNVSARNPNYQNTLGYDASIQELPNTANLQLGNSQTQATFRFSTTAESYTLSAVTTAISVYNPTFSFEKTATDVNGGSLNPGDIIRYRINYNNVGNDVSTNTVITDNIPAGTTYVPGSMNINGVARTDASGDDPADYSFSNNRVTFRIGTGATSGAGGTIAAAGSGYVEFNVYTPSSCMVASCTGPIRNSARVDYRGQTSGDVLYDSSGVMVSSCIVDGPVVSPLTAACYNPIDTILENSCPSLSVTLPYAKYAGYTFYSSTNFIPANIVNPYTAVTSTRVIYAYYNTGVGCVDTVRINVYITGCPDIDDDKDGIPDYIEINVAAATGDHDSDGIPNWRDTNYPGFVDNNLDGFNDNFDPGADSDNDGIPNFYDTNFSVAGAYVDSNGDAVNDNLDKDLDGIPNHLDRDSDNDGIPDVAESGGVDANGDGRIDNFTDTDLDGLSQNVDGSNTGIGGSGDGLGAIDRDGDGIPNYLDKDSDNDGIPDVIEVYGTDANNDGRLDGYTDSDGDGYADSVDGDVGNDGTAENSGASLFITGIDADNNGRADSYPNKNMDGDSVANPYDLDSDGDGITDVKEGYPSLDTNNDGRVDGTINSDGWSSSVSGLSLVLPNSDSHGRINAYDIDSDNDGIPDNIEGLPTAAYALPSGTDADGDGIDNTYDNSASYGGNGIPPVDTDSDGMPDYRDTDTDGDGLNDVVEGNDFNLNGLADDNVTLTGVDTDGDGLDDRFDLLNSSASGTSSRMGAGGSFTGPGSPGSNTVVQRTFSYYTDRDWRTVFILSCRYTSFKGSLKGKNALLEWSVVCDQEVDYFIIERSTDGINFAYANLVDGKPKNASKPNDYTTTDDVTGLNVQVIYYRLKTIDVKSKVTYSNTVTLQLNKETGENVRIIPNPVKDQLKLLITSPKRSNAEIRIFDANGKILMYKKQQLSVGENSIFYPETSALPDGSYYMRINIEERIIMRKFNKLK